MVLKRVNCFGDVEDFQYDINEDNEIQKSVIDAFDVRIQDIISYCLEDIIENQLLTIDELLEDEKSCNYSNGHPIYEYRASSKYGTEQNLDELFKRYSYIWSDYYFIESVGLTYDQLHWFYKLKDSIATVDEFLFWTMRLCGWGGYDFYHIYSFYKRLIAGRMKEFYNCPDNVIAWFVPKQ